MGLDMYLTGKKYLSSYNEKEKKIKDKIKPLLDIPFETNELSFELAYWRKENHIHQWFVKNVQDEEDNCQEFWVTKEQLQNLLDLCNEVISKSELVEGNVVTSQSLKDGEWVPNYIEGKVIKDSSTAMKLLPTQSGFFFGSTDYDEGYYNSLVYTKNVIEKIIPIYEELDVYYRSSW